MTIAVLESLFIETHKKLFASELTRRRSLMYILARPGSLEKIVPAVKCKSPADTERWRTVIATSELASVQEA
jgi:hypothetical protein